jgi:hypothetical protein
MRGKMDIHEFHSSMGDHGFDLFISFLTPGDRDTLGVSDLNQQFCNFLQKTHKYEV